MNRTTKQGKLFKKVEIIKKPGTEIRDVLDWKQQQNKINGDFVVLSNKKINKEQAEVEVNIRSIKPSIDKHTRGVVNQQKFTQGLQFKFAKDKSPIQHSRSITKKNLPPPSQQNIVLNKVGMNFPKSPRLFKPSFVNFKTKKEDKIQLNKIQTTPNPLKLSIETQCSPTKIFDSSLVQKQQPYENSLQLLPQIQRTQRTQSSLPYFLNKTDILTDLARQLNQKQVKNQQLQQKLSSTKNKLNTLIIQHSRQLKQKDQRLSQAAIIKSGYQYQIQLLQSHNHQLLDKLKMKDKQMNEIRIKQQYFIEQIEKLQKQNNHLQQSLSKVCNESDDNIIQEIRNELQQKGKLILQLQQRNQSLSIQVLKLKQNQQVVQTPVFSIPKDNNDFSVFQQAFKTYVQGINQYKSKVSEKQKQISGLKDIFGQTRRQNQHLKNQLKIEELRRVTQLRANGTILDVQRQSLINQLKDIKHQLSLSKEKTRSLTKEIKTKDQFIIKNIKT